MHEVRLENDNNVALKEFTEVFSWGSDRFGQLGLG
jgi:alpha-tubulin suppressor-like RCC1 family protein